MADDPASLHSNDILTFLSSVQAGLNRRIDDVENEVAQFGKVAVSTQTAVGSLEKGFERIEGKLDNPEPGTPLTAYVATGMGIVSLAASAIIGFVVLTTGEVRSDLIAEVKLRDEQYERVLMLVQSNAEGDSVYRGRVIASEKDVEYLSNGLRLSFAEIAQINDERRAALEVELREARRTIERLSIGE